jgi:hypothetical protein
MLCSLFSRLKSLFLLAPNKITLTGSYYWYNDDDVKTGQYEKLSFDKKKLIELFEKASSWNELLAADKNLYIMHFGI